MAQFPKSLEFPVKYRET